MRRHFDLYVHGGSWGSYPRYCRAAYRFGWDPTRLRGNLGFTLKI